MRLSSQKDLLLIITISATVLILGWLKLLKGYPLSLLPTILILILPGYTLLTAIWPNDERMGWTLRLGLGFVLGLFFILFLPLILNSLKVTSLTSNLNQILLILTIVFSLIAMARREEPEDEIKPSPGEAPFTLEESIQRTTLMRQKAELEADEYEDYYEGEYEDETKEVIPKGVPLQADEPVKTIPADYESEMDKPAWAEEPPLEKKSGFKYWDLVIILILSGVSLLFLYFNPLKTTTTSIIFFILLLFILGYAGLTIIYPDKSRVSNGKLVLSTTVIAIILFIVSFLFWWMHLLPAVPKYVVQILFVASIIMLAGAFTRKWMTTRDVTPGKEVAGEEILPEKVQVEKPGVGDEQKPSKQTFEEPSEEKTDTLNILKNIGKETIVDKKVSKDPSTKPSEKDKSNKHLIGDSKWEKALSIILIISLVLAISATIYIIVTPKQGEKFTEFYILGPDGKASNYPTNLTTGQNGSVIIGVVNHEYTTQDYLLVVKVNNSTLKNQTITLTNGQKLEIPYNFTAGTSGQKKMEFLLYKLPTNETSYRNLHLWLNVK